MELGPCGSCGQQVMSHVSLSLSGRAFSHCYEPPRGTQYPSLGHKGQLASALSLSCRGRMGLAGAESPLWPAMDKQKPASESGAPVATEPRVSRRRCVPGKSPLVNTSALISSFGMNFSLLDKAFNNCYSEKLITSWSSLVLQLFNVHESAELKFWFLRFHGEFFFKTRSHEEHT